MHACMHAPYLSSSSSSSSSNQPFFPRTTCFFIFLTFFSTHTHAHTYLYICIHRHTYIAADTTYIQRERERQMLLIHHVSVQIHNVHKNFQIAIHTCMLLNVCCLFCLLPFFLFLTLSLFLSLSFFVSYRSRDMPHEVLATYRKRFAITLWITGPPGPGDDL